MSREIKSAFSSVLSVNAYTNNYISYESNFVKEVKDSTFSKDQYVVSNFDIKDLISSHVSISKNIPEEDLYDAITTKAYDELGLDQAIEYQIHYVETFANIDEENKNYYVFIVDPFLIQETYKTVVEQIKYIDLIIPTPLLIKTLYSKNIILDGGVHCFVYFQKNDTFITIYNEQEFIYTKSLKYSFGQMHERFCELYGERVEYENFMDFFQKHNLKDTQSDYKEYFLKLYKEIFSSINDILAFAKRAYDLEKIEHIYIGSEVETVTKLDEILEFELQIKSSNFEFDYGFENTEQYIDQIQALMVLYTTLADEEKYLCNFTIFPRPPKFTQRQSGKLIMLITASIIIAFAYPATYWILTYAQSLQYNLLSNDYKKVHSIKSAREASIKEKEKEKTDALTLLNKEKQEYIDKKNTLIKIHDVKVNYPMKAKLLSTLTQNLNKYDVKLDTISYNENDDIKKFYLNLISSKDKQITSLIEYLTKVHEGRFEFSIEKIYYDEKTKKYFSKLEVKIL